MLRTTTGWVYSPSDLVDLLDCDLRSTLTLARAAGLDDAPEPGTGSDRLVVAHGVAHEQAQLDRFVDLFGDDVVRIGQPAPQPAALAAAAAQTRAALTSGAPVVYQAVFFDGTFYGRADFLVAAHLDPVTGQRRDGHTLPTSPGDIRYEPYDTKLARHARPAAVLQLVAYADALATAGFGLPEHMHLLLGDGTCATLRVAEFLPLLADVRNRVLDRLDQPATLPATLWADERAACGTCAFAGHCATEREHARDLSLVAGIRTDQRRKLRTAGLDTIDALAHAPDTARPANLATRTWEQLRAQARLQVAQDATRTPEDPTGDIRYEVTNSDALAALPAPAAGDIFFDMEGDPYALGNTGLEYLFGAITVTDPDTCPVTAPFDRHATVPAETFHEFWAHSRSQEKVAFEAFIDFAVAHLAAHPGSHIYHYAPYEPSALKRLAAQHGTREAQVDQLLRDGALVDLYAVVRKALRISQRSYSIKYLEPLYMPDHRTGDVTTAASSIEAYEEYLVHVENGDDVAAKTVLAGIGEYNEYDCVSTHRLLRWLLTVRAEAGIRPAAADTVLPDDVDTGRVAARQAQMAATEELTGRLMAGVPDDPAAWSADDRARHLLAAAVGYYRREANPAWWEFFAQQTAPLADLESDTSCTVPLRVEADDWVQPTGRARLASRRVTCQTDPDAPHPFATGDTVRLLYPSAGGAPGTARNGSVVDAGPDHVAVQEKAKVDQTTDQMPVAVLPGPPINATPKDAAVTALAEDTTAHLAMFEQLPDGAALDLLRRRPPRLRSGRQLPHRDAHGGELVDTVLAAVDDLDESYLAVQGPPGAGKTYLATRLIQHLVGTSRTVGVCSTSHKAIENVLLGVTGPTGTGADGSAGPVVPCAKRAKPGTSTAVPWDTPKSSDALAAWRTQQPVGHLVGGTAWHFAHPAVAAEPFDVLIVDEAGQFALTDVLAISGAARNLVLLGDPQQLPQVVAGTHPDGAAASALGHLLDGEDIVPPQFGYFLDRTRRMHPAVCAPVSALSYRGLLRSHEVAAGRAVGGVEPGLRTVFVDHVGNTTHSPQEAAAVVDLVADMVGRPWRDGPRRRTLTAADVLVVAPYNRQVRALERGLASAGFSGVRVGTVDRFQGQEAPVVIASMTSSTAADLPRGLDFLLDPHRLNVALSRAQAVAYLVCSPALSRTQVRSVTEMRLVSGLLGLLNSSQPT